MHSRRSRLSLLWICSAILLVSLAYEEPLASGQTKPRSVILPTTGTNALKEMSKNREISGRLKILREGQEPASKDKPDDFRAVDYLAQWYAYRLTWPEIQVPSAESRADNLSRLLSDFDREIGQFNRYKPQNQSFVDLFNQQAVLRLKEVLQNDRPIASLNVSRMLVSLVREGCEEASDALAEALNDPSLNDGAKYYALQGLKMQFARWGAADASTPAPRTRAARERMYIQSILQTIDRKQPFDLRLVSVKEERDGLREGLRLFRREAVRAASASRLPAVADDKGALSLRVAHTLLRVVNNDGMTPSPRLDEQIEAAMGVAQLRSRLIESYQPDYAAQQIGHLVVEMAARTGDKATSTDPRVTGFPWKYQASRLGDALETMRAEAKGLKDAKAANHVAQVVVQSLRVLKDIEVGGLASASDLKTWLDATPPPNSTLYRGMADATVKPLTTSEEEEASDKPQPEKPKEAPKPAKPTKPAPDKKGGAPKR